MLNDFFFFLNTNLCFEKPITDKANQSYSITYILAFIFFKLCEICLFIIIKLVTTYPDQPQLMFPKNDGQRQSRNQEDSITMKAVLDFSYTRNMIKKWHLDMSRNHNCIPTKIIF